MYVIVFTGFKRYPSIYYLMQSICGIVATVKILKIELRVRITTFKEWSPIPPCLLALLEQNDTPYIS